MSIAVSIANFHELLFEALRKMDEEATNWSYDQGDEYPTGLRLYGMHVDPNRDPKKNPRHRIEGAWPDRLAEILSLSDNGMLATAFPKYRESGEKGDLLVRFPDSTKLFLEMKPALTYVRETPQKIGSNASLYKWHLLNVPKHAKDKKGAAYDFHKLRSLSANDADYAGVVLVAFDLVGRFEVAETDIDQMKRNAARSRREAAAADKMAAKQHPAKADRKGKKSKR